MTVKLGLPWLTAIIIMSACGSDGSSDEDSEGSNSKETEDAGAEDAGAKDAGRVSDARADSSAASHNQDAKVTQGEDAGEEEPTTPHDAGLVDGSSDVHPGDAGHVDAASHDAGAADAGSTGDGGVCEMLTYDSFGQTFLSTYCVGCHGPTIAQKNVRLDSLAGVTAAKTRVKSEVSIGSMPPRGSKAPSSQERTELGEWIDCGPK